MYSIESFPKSETVNFDLLIAGTKGIFSGDSLKRASNILKSSGYHISGYADVTMPGSDGLAFLAEGSATVKKMCNKNFFQIEPLEGLIEKIRNDIRVVENFENTTSSVTIPVTISGVILDALFKLTYVPITHWMKGKFRADENCVRCGLCKKICPSHNIEVTDNGICFDGRCYLCMRCIHQCPQAAIQIGKGTVGKMRWKGPDGKFKPRHA